MSSGPSLARACSAGRSISTAGERAHLRGRRQLRLCPRPLPQNPPSTRASSGSHGCAKTERGFLQINTWLPSPVRGTTVESRARTVSVTSPRPRGGSRGWQGRDRGHGLPSAGWRACAGCRGSEDRGTMAVACCRQTLRGVSFREIERHSLPLKRELEMNRF